MSIIKVNKSVFAESDSIKSVMITYLNCEINKNIIVMCIIVTLLSFTIYSGVLHAHPPTVEKAISFIEENQNEDGGWGYWPGRDSYTEPTGICVLALKISGNKQGLVKGLEYLKKCQLSGGGIGINHKDTQGNWMSYAALLAFYSLGASEEEKRLKKWILDFYDGYENIPPDVVESMYQEFRFDMTIDGWPWFGSTNSWVEPTSLFIVALIYSGVSPDNKRIRSGLKLLLNRTNREGGWNYGNPFVKNTYLEAYSLPTSIALLAMGVAVYTTEITAVKKAINFLEQRVGNDMSNASLAWSLLAFKNFKKKQGEAEKIASILKKRQLSDGSFRGNLFETSLSYLALSAFTFNRNMMEIK